MMFLPHLCECGQKLWTYCTKGRMMIMSIQVTSLRFLVQAKWVSCANDLFKPSDDKDSNESLPNNCVCRILIAKGSYMARFIHDQRLQGQRTHLVCAHVLADRTRSRAYGRLHIPKQTPIATSHFFVLLTLTLMLNRPQLKLRLADNQHTWFQALYACPPIKRRAVSIC